LKGTPEAAKDVLNSYDDFVGELKRLCEPQAMILKTYKKILESAHNLHKFWHEIDDSKLSVRERRDICFELVRELERHKNIKKFYDEFSMAMLTSELLQPISDKDRKT